MEIYSYTAGKYGRSALERLTGDTIDISEWLEIEFSDLVRFWNNQSDDTKPMLRRWLGVSHRVGSALCNCILSEKRNFLSPPTVQHLNTEELIDPDVQEQIHDYHGSLEDALRSDDFGTSLGEYEPFINDDKEGIDKGDPNEKGYQGPPDSPEIDEIIDNSDEERAANSYDQ